MKPGKVLRCMLLLAIYGVVPGQSSTKYKRCVHETNTFPEQCKEVIHE